MAYRGILFALLVLLTLGIVAAVLPQEHGGWFVRDGHAQASPPVEVRIAAQRLESGSTEFALQIIDQATGQASARLLPSPRFLSSATSPSGWRNSGPVTLPHPHAPHTVRISARLLEDGRLEFSLQQRGLDDQWSERVLPNQRLFPAYPLVRTWLVSSNVQIPEPTYIPVVNVRGRFSYAGRYESTLFRGVIGSDIRNVSLNGDAQLSLLCQYGLSLSLLSLPEFDADPVVVKLTFPSGMTSTSAWRRYDRTTLQSPDPWTDFNRLQEAESVSVEIPGLLPHAQQIDLTDMFTTPIQGNLEHCGSYAPGEISDRPSSVRTYSAGQFTTVNGALSEARWSVQRQPGTLSRVVLIEQHFQRPSDSAPANSPFSLSLNLTCDRHGLSIRLYGSVIDSALDRDHGVNQSVRWLLDGDPLVNFPWQQAQDALYLRDARASLDTVRLGSLLEVSLSRDSSDTFAFDLSALFGSPAQSAFDECVEYPVRVDPLPYSEFPAWQRASVPGVSYRIGSDSYGGLSWWTEVVIDEQSVWVGEPSAHQQLHISCGLDGIGVELTNVGASQPVFLRGWPPAVEVTWHTDVDSVTESWDVWNLEFHRNGFSLSPPDDREFLERISGAETLTVSVPTEPHPVTLSFALGEIGVWDTPVGVNLEACDHGGSEPG